MTEREPNLVHSGLSRSVTISGKSFEVLIYKIEGTSEWSMEVVDEDRASTLWDETFPTDAEADAEFRRTLKEEGVAAFLQPTKVIPFPRR